MTYIRNKEVGTNKYAYLVENISTPKGPRQKVRKYLGKVHDLSDSHEFAEVKEKEVLMKLIKVTLKSTGFSEKNGEYHYEGIVFNPTTLDLSKKGKQVVISVNNGHFCNFTLLRIKNFKKTKDLTKDAQVLAKYFLDAGLLISEEEFVDFYKKS